jgi:hypothetical protein
MNPGQGSARIRRRKGPLPRRRPQRVQMLQRAGPLQTRNSANRLHHDSDRTKVDFADETLRALGDHHTDGMRHVFRC